MSDSELLGLPSRPHGPMAAVGDTSEQSGIVARQAILDRDQRVIGYELFNRLAPNTAHSSNSDAALLFNVLSLADAPASDFDKLLFVNCTHESLHGRHLSIVHPAHVVLKLPPIAGHADQQIEASAETMRELSQRGFRFAFDHTVLSRNYASWRPFVSFVRLDLQRLKPELIEPMLRYARQHTSAQLIATKVETGEQQQRMLHHGVELFQGYWFAQPTVLKAQTIRPAQTVVLQLIERVRDDAQVSEIEEVLKKDPTLSFTLLKYINSSGFGLHQSVTSFRHAVMLLGMQQLFRWAVLLLTLTRPGGVSPAVGATAIVRGRLTELLARESGRLTDQQCDAAFVVGVFSLLDLLLGVTLAEAVATVTLPEAVVHALLHRRGLYAPYLELAEACERADDAVFARVAIELKLSNRQVNYSHLQALAWADHLLT